MATSASETHEQHIELETLKGDAVDGAPRAYRHWGAEDKKSPCANNDSDATEKHGLLTSVSNGTTREQVYSVNDTEAQINGNYHSPTKNSCIYRIKRELNSEVCGTITLKAVIIFFFVLVAVVVVILISVAVCAALHEDEDENFNRSMFTVPLFFNGSFQMPNQVFTEELSTNSSVKNQVLARALQMKVEDLYRSSPALARYFSKAEIHAFRNGSVIADYMLTFLLPQEELNQLRSFTLSREMVYNVFRQFLYDQEPLDSGPLFIDPVSLKMF